MVPGGDHTSDICLEVTATEMDEFKPSIIAHGQRSSLCLPSQKCDTPGIIWDSCYTLMDNELRGSSHHRGHQFESAKKLESASI